MRTLIFLLLLTLTTQAQAQDSTKRYTFKEIGWTITLPAEFTEIDPAESKERVERGKKLIEESNDIVTDISALKTLFTATKNTFQYLSSTIEPFDSKKDGDYKLASKKVKDIAFNTLKDKMPDAQIDSVTEKLTIDGLIFDKFIITIKIKDQILTMVLIGKLYKGYDFGISYLYMDEETQKQIEASIRNSKFRKWMKVMVTAVDKLTGW